MESCHGLRGTRLSCVSARFGWCSNIRANIRRSGKRWPARRGFEKFDFEAQITRLDRSNLLYLVISKFAYIDLHPDAVSNLEIGYFYERSGG